MNRDVQKRLALRAKLAKDGSTRLAMTNEWKESSVKAKIPFEESLRETGRENRLLFVASERAKVTVPKELLERKLDGTQRKLECDIQFPPEREEENNARGLNSSVRLGTFVVTPNVFPPIADEKPFRIGTFAVASNAFPPSMVEKPCRVGTFAVAPNYFPPTVDEQAFRAFQVGPAKFPPEPHSLRMIATRPNNFPPVGLRRLGVDPSSFPEESSNSTRLSRLGVKPNMFPPVVSQKLRQLSIGATNFPPT